MRRSISILLTVLFIGLSYIVVKFIKEPNTKPYDNSAVSYNIIAAGLKDSRDFVSDGSSYFIAFKDKIQVIENNGKSYTLMEESSLDIKSMEYNGGKLYLLSGPYLMSYDLKDKTLKQLIKDLPTFGDYSDGKLLVKDNILYISIGAATNSGVVGEDNKWIEQYPFNHDIYPKDIVINENGNSKNGGFVPYNTKNIPGQKISGHFPGNASVITFNLSNGTTSQYCYGVRNVKGMDYNSEGKIYASIGGMEPRGARPVKGDTDYIYELKEGTWYGWPDFSGGDPITSPRFKGEKDERISFLLQKHPTNNPPAPVYQHKSIASLSALVVDKSGVLGNKDSIYFCDNTDNILYSMDKKGVVEKKLTLNDNLKVTAIKIINDNMLMLENKEGYLIAIGNNSKDLNQGTKIILLYVIALIAFTTILIVWKMKKIEK